MLYFFFMLLKVKGTFLQKRGVQSSLSLHNTFKTVSDPFKNGILSGKFSIPLELSNDFLLKVIRRLKISVSKNHTVEEKLWFWVTASLLAGRVP